jgi:carbonic anhydrase
MDNKPHGLVDNWLRHVRDIQQRHHRKLDNIKDETERINRLCELNVVEQVINVGNTTIIQDAWKRQQEIAVHGWVYDISDGLLRDLNVCIRSDQELDALQKKVLP